MTGVLTYPGLEKYLISYDPFVQDEVKDGGRKVQFTLDDFIDLFRKKGKVYVYKNANTVSGSTEEQVENGESDWYNSEENLLVTSDSFKIEFDVKGVRIIFPLFVPDDLQDSDMAQTKLVFNYSRALFLSDDERDIDKNLERAPQLRQLANRFEEILEKNKSTTTKNFDTSIWQSVDTVNGPVELYRFELDQISSRKTRVELLEGMSEFVNEYFESYPDFPKIDIEHGKFGDRSLSYDLVFENVDMSDLPFEPFSDIVISSKPIFNLLFLEYDIIRDLRFQAQKAQREKLETSLVQPRRKPEKRKIDYYEDDDNPYIPGFLESIPTPSGDPDDPDDQPESKRSRAFARMAAALNETKGDVVAAMRLLTLS